jgi:hypothetical protein
MALRLESPRFSRTEDSDAGQTGFLAAAEGGYDLGDRFIELIGCIA